MIGINLCLPCTLYCSYATMQYQKDTYGTDLWKYDLDYRDLKHSLSAQYLINFQALVLKGNLLMMISYLSHTLHGDAWRRQFHVDRACLVSSVCVPSSFCCGLWPELVHLCLQCTWALPHPKGLLQLLMAAATLICRGWREARMSVSCITDWCYSPQFYWSELQ
jgi:hypothetical protein